MTLISEHTSGKWEGSSRDLAGKIRPFFRVFIPLCLANGIRVAIVTFSEQTQLISDLLHLVFPDQADLIPVRGEDSSWGYRGGGCHEGKQKHMASAAEELIVSNASSGLKITRATTLLVDDDLKNVFVAIDDGTRAVLCDPTNVRKMIDDLLVME